MKNSPKRVLYTERIKASAANSTTILPIMIAAFCVLYIQSAKALKPTSIIKERTTPDRLLFTLHSHVLSNQCSDGFRNAVILLFVFFGHITKWRMDREITQQHIFNFLRFFRILPFKSFPFCSKTHSDTQRKSKWVLFSTAYENRSPAQTGQRFSSVRWWTAWATWTAPESGKQTDPAVLPPIPAPWP